MKVASTGASFYPDLSVVCGKVETPESDANAIANPLVLVEVQRRNEHRIWELHFFGPGERVELSSLGVSVSVDAVYANPLQGQ